MKLSVNVIPIATAMLFAMWAPFLHSAWDVYPEFSVEGGVDENPRLRVNSDAGTTGSAEGSLFVRNVTENSDVVGQATLKRSEAWGIDLDGATSGAAGLTAEKRTERIQYGVVGRYDNEEMRRTAAVDLETGEVLGLADRLYDQSEYDPSDPDLDIGYIEDELRRQRSLLMPYVGYSLSPRSRVRLQGLYHDVHFSGESSVELKDSQTYGAAVFYSYRLSEQSSLTATVGSQQFEPDDAPDVLRHQFMLGYARQFSELTRVQVQAGVSYVDSDSGVEDTVGVYRATLQHRFESGELSLLVHRNNWPTGFGNVVQTDRFVAGWTQSLTERWELSMSGQYSTTDSNLESGVNSSDRDYLDFETRAGYALSREWTLGIGHRYRWVDRKEQTDTADGNAAFVFLTYSPPRPF